MLLPQGSPSPAAFGAPGSHHTRGTTFPPLRLGNPSPSPIGHLPCSSSPCSCCRKGARGDPGSSEQRRGCLQVPQGGGSSGAGETPAPEHQNPLPQCGRAKWEVLSFSGPASWENGARRIPKRWSVETTSQSSSIRDNASPRSHLGNGAQLRGIS